MTLADLRTNLKQAMISKDAEKMSVIRMVISAIGYKAMNLNMKDSDLPEEEVNNVILREIKTRSEAIEEFEKNGKDDLAVKEKNELEILKEFAPKQMSEDEVAAEVKNLLSAIDPKPAMGPAIGIVMKSLKGKADPGMVSKAVGEFMKN